MATGKKTLATTSSTLPFADPQSARMPSNKFFIQTFLRSHSTHENLIMTVKDGVIKEDAPIVLDAEKPYDFSQIFYKHVGTNTIRTYCGDLCLTNWGGKLVLKPFMRLREQRWSVRQQFIMNDEDQVLAVGGRTHDAEIGDECVIETSNWQDNQKWKEKECYSECYFIESRKYEGMVMDVRCSSLQEATPIIIYPRHREYYPGNQLFYADKETKTIRSALGTKFCFTGTPAGIVKVKHFQPGHVSQKWVITEEGIIENAIDSGLVLALKEHEHSENGRWANVEVVNRDDIDQANQHKIVWNIVRD